MKKLLFISVYEGSIDGYSVSRFNQLYSKLYKKYDVEVISNDFNHSKKEKRKINITEYEKNHNCKLTLLPSPTYKKNISIKRIVSYIVFAHNVKKYISDKEYDVVYCLVPDIFLGRSVAKSCIKKNIPYIVDIQDLWPEGFKVKYDNIIIDFFIYRKLRKIADYIYNNSSGMVAISETYLMRGLKNKEKKNDAIVVYNGIELEEYKKSLYQYFKNDDDEFWIIYIGTLGNCYNIPLVIESLKKIKDSGDYNIKFICLGDGPYREEWKQECLNYHINSLFLSFSEISFETMIGYLGSSDVAINPIYDNAAQSITNKIRDYAASGLPVINTQQNKEYRKIVDNLNIGINCKNDVNDVSNAIIYLYNNPQVISDMKTNVINKFQERFDSSKTYDVIVDLIDKVVN